jgi:hypothetical protein
VTAGQANADPFNTPAHQGDMAQMCIYLKYHPSVSGVVGIIQSWQAHYGTSDAAAQMGAQTLLDAITYDCPEYAGIVYQAVQEYKLRHPSQPSQPTPSVPVSPDGIEHDTVV